MNGFFDFSSPHLLQVPPLPTQPTNGTCDETLESSPNPLQCGCTGDGTQRKASANSNCGGPVFSKS